LHPLAGTVGETPIPRPLRMPGDLRQHSDRTGGIR
jgi:hypothetical protein